MIVIAGTVEIDVTMRDEVIEATIEVMQETRKQPGCISFVLSADLEDRGVLHVFQEWESPEALDHHLRELRIELVELRIGNRTVRKIAVQRYAIQSVGAIV